MAFVVGFKFREGFIIEAARSAHHVIRVEQITDA
jgi:hypothetical protein